MDYKEKIEGKTLEVYEYLAEHPGTHGVREIKRALDNGSPSTVYYHLNKLLELDYIDKNQNSRYFVDLEVVKLGNVGSHLQFMGYWVPRSLFYAIPLLFLFILSVVFYIIGIDTPEVWVLSISPVLTIISVALLKDSIYFSRKLQQAWSSSASDSTKYHSVV